MTHVIARWTAAQHGFYARPSAHLPCLATMAGLGRITRSSDIVRFVQGGVVKPFRYPPLVDEYGNLLSQC